MVSADASSCSGGIKSTSSNNCTPAIALEKFGPLGSSVSASSAHSSCTWKPLEVLLAAKPEPVIEPFTEPFAGLVTWRTLPRQALKMAAVVAGFARPLVGVALPDVLPPEDLLCAFSSSSSATGGVNWPEDAPGECRPDVRNSLDASGDCCRPAPCSKCRVLEPVDCLDPEGEAKLFCDGERPAPLGRDADPAGEGPATPC